MNAYLCTTCSTENRPNAKFCRKCGQARKHQLDAPDDATLKSIVCQSCSIEILASDRFCVSCGAKQVIVPKPQDKTCYACAKKLPFNANFCTHCGTNVSGGVAKMVAPSNPIASESH